MRETKQKVYAIIVAAGKGERFGQKKQYLYLKGKILLEYSLEVFNNHPLIDEIILVLEKSENAKIFENKYSKIKEVVQGGERRTDSVYSGFQRIRSKEHDLVLIHDGVRPLVTQDLITRVIETTKKKGTAVPVIKIDDALKYCENNEIIKTLQREKIFRAQTPQGFIYNILKKAFDKAKEENYFGPDEAYLVEKTGVKVSIVEGDPMNIKITTPHDLKLVEFCLND
jgi:2-C-methyl-D-erythritol 4-phosphate cytidylyltransferase